jgi:hypothetical protein
MRRRQLIHLLILLPKPRLVPNETPETVVASQSEEVATKTDAADDKETIPPSVIDDSGLPTIEASLDEMPTDQSHQTHPEAAVEVGEVATGEEKA